ncbi:hypothetical protein [Lawsonibacter sp. JLR.KK007]|uniref:hypothetical protein n=1 Tax=Lawsonibacter sp. JLR.KK007 TaxID=3114293 RepID=UPI002FF0FA26
MTSYDFYQNTYRGGSIPPEEWPGYAARAAAQLARYKRLCRVDTSRPRSGDMAVCAMAEAFYSFDLLANGEGGPIQSASIGSVSVSYSGPAGQSLDLSPRGREKELYRCASQYLDIYRGCG